MSVEVIKGFDERLFQENFKLVNSICSKLNKIYYYEEERLCYFSIENELERLQLKLFSLGYFLRDEDLFNDTLVTLEKYIGDKYNESKETLDYALSLLIRVLTLPNFNRETYKETLNLFKRYDKKEIAKAISQSLLSLLVDDFKTKNFTKVLRYLNDEKTITFLNNILYEISKEHVTIRIPETKKEYTFTFIQTNIIEKVVNILVRLALEDDKEAYEKTLDLFLKCKSGEEVEKIIEHLDKNKGEILIRRVPISSLSFEVI